MEKLTEPAPLELSMMDYGMYVWPSFIITFFIILAMAAVSLRALQRAKKKLAQMQSETTDYET